MTADRLAEAIAEIGAIADPCSISTGAEYKRRATKALKALADYRSQAPAEGDSRAAFERWLSHQSSPLHLYGLGRDDSDRYGVAIVQAAWWAWQASAKQAKPQPKGTKLALCPFCGRRPVLTVRPDNADATSYFAAVACFCDGYAAGAHKDATAAEADEAERLAREKWNTRAAAQAPAPAPRTSCEYCDGTGDVHSLDGEWRGECNQCPAAALHAFKNFHRLLCERFGYGHDERDWRRDQLSLIEFIAAKVQAPAVTPGDLRAMFEWVEEAVCYVNEECKSPSLEREGRALLLKLRNLLRTAASKGEANPPVQPIGERNEP